MYDGKILYRLHHVYFLDLNTKIDALSIDALSYEEYGIWKETEKGYWIVLIEYLHNVDLYINTIKRTKKWMSKTATKRFAWETKEEALLSFIIRKSKYMTYMKNKMIETNKQLYVANQIYEKVYGKKEESICPIQKMSWL